MFYKDERLALFIDGPNLHLSARALGFEIDYKLLFEVFQERGKLLRAYYFTALLESPESSAIRPLTDWLEYNGYCLISKPAKHFTDGMGITRTKGNMDVDIAVTAMELVMTARLQHLVLFSGDGDFRPLVEALQRQGVRVSVVSTRLSQPSPMIADELRRQADNFIELNDLRELVGKLPKASQELE